jgi:hypothetical protein
LKLSFSLVDSDSSEVALETISKVEDEDAERKRLDDFAKWLMTEGD